jgi:photosystem II stability/assembly factor-like uncharacterized protein
MAQVEIYRRTRRRINILKEILLFPMQRRNNPSSKPHNLTAAKLFPLIILLLFADLNYSTAQWMNSTGNSSYLDAYRSVYFFDSKTGYITGFNNVSGNYGVILYTSDGGLNWVNRSIVADYYLYCICFINKNRGYIGGSDGTILRTDDGGISWVRQNSGTKYNLSGISFINEDTGLAAGNGFFTPVIVRTTNGGINWINIPLDTNLDLYDVCMTDIKHGFAVGNRSILQTDDGGITWIRNPIGYYFYLFDLSFPNPMTGYTTGYPLYSNYRGCVLRTTDGGGHWFNFSPDDTVYKPMDIHFTNSEHGYTAGWFGKIYKTTDAGHHWTAQNSGTESWLYAIHFINENTGWIAGDYGTILHTSNGGINWILQQGKTPAPESFGLHQNYPNPFNNSTTIKYSISRRAKVSIKVYNVLGQQIINLVDEFKEPGIHSAVFNGTNLASGVYFYRLEITKPEPLVPIDPSFGAVYTETKKLILIK